MKKRIRTRADKPRDGMAIKVTEEERIKLTQAAGFEGLAPSSFVAVAALERADAIIKKYKARPKT